MTSGARLCSLLAAVLLCVPALPAGAHDATMASTPAPMPGQTLALPALSAEAAAAAAADDHSILFIGTATVLIRYGGMTILTDPNFLHKGGHVPLGYGLTSERLTEPAMNIEDLPPVDLVLLSHFHGDHFDQLVQEKLPRTLPIVTTPQSSLALENLGFTRRHALRTWDTMTVNKGVVTLRISAMPGRHGPPVLAGLLPAVMGSMLEFSRNGGAPDYRIYITGDTMVYDDLREIPQRFPDIDLALLHLGGTRILGVMKVTMDGEDGVRMMQLVAPQHAIPIHYNDYTVFKSPLSDFERAVKAAELQNKVSYLKHGETYRYTPKPR
ncbi:MAG: fold metallo-hydrolase [Burkholderia sp.]|nr:fold metallo-hydrolase [Burkholderia sp.]